MIFVPYANDKGVDTVIKLNTSESGFESGYDRIFYIGSHLIYDVGFAPHTSPCFWLQFFFRAERA